MTTMSDKEIETIQNKLLHFALEGDREATRQYADLYLSRRNWEQTRSAKDREDFVDQVQDADVWLNMVGAFQ